MRIIIEKRIEYTVDVDPKAHSELLPVEYREFIGAANFVRETLHEIGGEEALYCARTEVDGFTLVDTDTFWHVDIRG